MVEHKLSPFILNAKNKMTNIKNKAQNGAQKFKKNLFEVKSKPRSKRKSFFLGFTIVLGIFGVRLLPAVAKNIPNNGAKPGDVCPSPTPSNKPALVPSQQITNGLAGAAATVCALAISSGSFMIGAVCGVIVVVGILKAQGK